MPSTLIKWHFFISFQDENIKMDPVLNTKCAEDEKKFCPNAKADEAQVIGST